MSGAEDSIVQVTVDNVVHEKAHSHSDDHNHGHDFILGHKHTFNMEHMKVALFAAIIGIGVKERYVF